MPCSIHSFCGVRMSGGHFVCIFNGIHMSGGALCTFLYGILMPGKKHYTFFLGVHMPGGHFVNIFTSCLSVWGVLCMRFYVVSSCLGVHFEKDISIGGLYYFMSFSPGVHCFLKRSCLAVMGAVLLWKCCFYNC